MRYFLLIFALVVVLVISLAGYRGDTSRLPPLEVFPDMDRQLKVRPQSVSTFFADGMGSRLPVEGTIARGAAFEATSLNTGLIPGTTNYVQNIQTPVTMELLERGQERYNISCTVCHGAAGDGRGAVSRYGLPAANMHDVRFIQMSDGEIFYVITHGRGQMGPYGPLIDIQDRWAIVAYVRALQRSRLMTLDEVPEEIRAKLQQ